MQAYLLLLLLAVFTCVTIQARVEEVGQALLRRTQDAGGFGPRRKGKRSRFHMDAYEEHMLLPEVRNTSTSSLL